jgi:hypothetical protein
MMAARYDRTVTRALLDPLMDRLPRLVAWGVSYLPDSIFAAPAFVDPRRAVALVAGLPAADDPRRGDWGAQRRLIARVLSAWGDDRGRLAVQYAGFWSVDAYDLVDDD